MYCELTVGGNKSKVRNVPLLSLQCCWVQFLTELPVFPNFTVSNVQNEDFSLCSKWIFHERSAVTLVYRSMVRGMANHLMA